LNLSLDLFGRLISRLDLNHQVNSGLSAGFGQQFSFG